MPTAAQVLGKFAAELTFADIPTPVVERTKDCIIDTVAVSTFGAQLPWGRIVAEYARRYGSGGPCSVMGFPDMRVQAPYAALANGALATAFEHDSLREPGAGAHAGATLLATVLAACEETHADGKTAIAAFVAGCEVVFRVAVATRHSPEKIGFHAPALTAPYGAAVAAGRIFGLSAEQMGHAIGIASSLSCGLLAFTKSKQGGMIKCLHLGRGAESGILAARLASAGYTGPETALEGKFGFLEAYCRDGDAKPLTAGLRDSWETLRICLKRYPCHMAAHIPVQTLRELMTENGFGGPDVEQIVVEVSEKVLSHHNIPEPGDVTQSQYSVPFCVALALFRDPDDAKSFDASAIKDPLILAASRSMELRARGTEWRSAWGMEITVRLKDGRTFARKGETFKGMADYPLSPAELRRKFMTLTTSMDAAVAAQLYERLAHLEIEPHFL